MLLMSHRQRLPEAFLRLSKDSLLIEQKQKIVSPSDQDNCTFSNNVDVSTVATSIEDTSATIDDDVSVSDEHGNMGFSTNQHDVLQHASDRSNQTKWQPSCLPDAVTADYSKDDSMCADYATIFAASEGQGMSDATETEALSAEHDGLSSSSSTNTDIVPVSGWFLPPAVSLSLSTG